MGTLSLPGLEVEAWRQPGWVSAYLLSTYYVPSAALGIGDTAVNETKPPPLWGTHSSVFGGGTNKEYVQSSQNSPCPWEALPSPPFAALLRGIQPQTHHPSSSRGLCSEQQTQNLLGHTVAGGSP